MLWVLRVPTMVVVLVEPPVRPSALLVVPTLLVVAVAVVVIAAVLPVVVSAMAVSSASLMPARPQAASTTSVRCLLPV